VCRCVDRPALKNGVYGFVRLLLPFFLTKSDHWSVAACVGCLLNCVRPPGCLGAEGFEANDCLFIGESSWLLHAFSLRGGRLTRCRFKDRYGRSSERRVHADFQSWDHSGYAFLFCRST